MNEYFQLHMCRQNVAFRYLQITFKWIWNLVKYNTNNIADIGAISAIERIIKVSYFTLIQSSEGTVLDISSPYIQY